MLEFLYKATRSDGTSVTGEVAATTLAEAIAELESRGLSIESIRLSTAGDAMESSAQFESPAKLQPVPLESHFVTAIERKEVLVPALTALASEMPAGRGRQEIYRLAAALRDARTSTDLRRSKIAIEWLPMLVKGFNAESSTRRLSEVISQASRESHYRSQRRRQLVYPFSVFLLALALLLFLAVAIVPTFDDMFSDFGLMLPTPTRLVMFLSNEIRFHFLRFMTLGILLATAIYAGGRIWTHYAITTQLFGVFTAGNTSSLSAMSSLTSQLAELLSINLSLPDALWIAGQSCQHYHFKNVAEQLARDAHDQTAPLSQSPVAHNFPANVIRALESGADGKPHIGLLRELSSLYGDRANRRVDWSTGAFAQFAIVIVGLTVGFVVIALFAPLLSMVTSLS